jgi:hypothetical protein
MLQEKGTYYLLSFSSATLFGATFYFFTCCFTYLVLLYLHVSVVCVHLLSCLCVCREAWPTEPSKVAEVEADFCPGRPDVGDRRQELVFIGINVRVGVVLFCFLATVCPVLALCSVYSYR